MPNSLPPSLSPLLQQLTDSELGNLDSLYRLLAPSRAGNPSYRSDLLLASDHFLLLFEQSSKAVIGTNCIHFLTFPFLPLTLDISLTLTPYPPDKELYELLQKVEACEYFDKPHDDEEEDEEDDEEEEEEEEEEVVEREPEVCPKTSGQAYLVLINICPVIFEVF